MQNKSPTEDESLENIWEVSWGELWWRNWEREKVINKGYYMYITLSCKIVWIPIGPPYGAAATRQSLRPSFKSQHMSNSSDLLNTSTDTYINTLLFLFLKWQVIVDLKMVLHVLDKENKRLYFFQMKLWRPVEEQHRFTCDKSFFNPQMKWRQTHNLYYKTFQHWQEAKTCFKKNTQFGIWK